MGSQLHQTILNQISLFGPPDTSSHLCNTCASQFTLIRYKVTLHQSQVTHARTYAMGLILCLKQKWRRLESNTARTHLCDGLDPLLEAKVKASGKQYRM
jgi:hypothetical protein